MKHLRLPLLALFSLMMLTSCDDEKVITVAELPPAAQTFVGQTYATQTIVVVKKETELFSTKYKVMLDNGMEIEFDKNGQPIDVDN